MTPVHAEQGMSGDEVIEKTGAMGVECHTPELERLVHGFDDRGDD